MLCEKQGAVHATLPGEFSMSLDLDVIVDRRRIRRKLTFWRVLAVWSVAALATVGVMVMPAGRKSAAGAGSIARIKIEGVNRSIQAASRPWNVWKIEATAAVVVHINSPGGTTAGSEKLYDRCAAESKEAAGRGGRRTGGVGRLYRRDRGRPYRRAAEFAGRLDRRAVPVPNSPSF